MKTTIYKSALEGKIEIPGSKSQTIRALVAATLSSGNSYIKNVSMCDDVVAAINAAIALGAKVKFYIDSITQKKCLKISGINYELINQLNNQVIIDCKDSATVLRFFLSIVAVLGIKTKFILSENLMKRPLNDLINELIKHGIKYIKNFDKCLIISEGKISDGDFFINANVSSQYISGLLFALPLIKNVNSNKQTKIYLKSEICSKQYVDMTLDILDKFGIDIKVNQDNFEILKNQKFKSTTIDIEGDYSLAANFLVAKNINSANLIIDNLPQKTVQKEKIILDIIDKTNKTSKISIDANGYIDLVPILAVLFCYKKIIAKIFNIKRLKIKESNRLEAICESLIKMGGNIFYTDNEIIIKGNGKLNGGVFLDGYNDHRIIMALTIAGLNAEKPIIISGIEAVSKSFPDFNDIINDKIVKDKKQKLKFD